MISNLSTIFTLLILLLTACFGYYRGILVLATFRWSSKKLKGLETTQRFVFGLMYLLGAIVASTIAVLFYFSL